jgi:hypothetical protein
MGGMDGRTDRRLGGRIAWMPEHEAYECEMSVTYVCDMSTACVR